MPNKGTDAALQLRIEELGPFHAQLVRALGEQGLAGNHLGELLARGVVAECLLCGMRLTGEDIQSVVLTDRSSKLEDPRLERVRQGYCGRRGCDSHYYSLRFEPRSGVDWPAVIESAQKAPPPEETPEKPESAEEQPPPHRRSIRLAAVASVLLLLLLAKYIHSGGRIPFLSGAGKYEVDPGSVETWTVEP